MEHFAEQLKVKNNEVESWKAKCAHLEIHIQEGGFDSSKDDQIRQLLNQIEKLEIELRNVHKVETIKNKKGPKLPDPQIEILEDLAK